MNATLEKRHCSQHATRRTLGRKMASTEQHEGAANASPRFVLPWDLSEWADKAVLLRGVVADIDSLDWQHPAVTEYLRARPEFQPKMMLQLLTYAYSLGVFGADDVEALFLGHKSFAALGWDRPPRVKAIGRFRRENRGLLKWSLLQTLNRVVRARYDLGTRLLPGLQWFLVDNAVQRLDLARQVDQSSAED
ncbi:MAG: hypothetical protein JXQ71_15640 [Verrucomicrobia bacterium]|nr:hypothetical protein [Verrucomicrobiota bacterium]